MATGAEALSRWYEERLGCPPLIRVVGKAAIDPGWPTGGHEHRDRWRAKLAGWTGNVGLVTGFGLLVVDADLYKGPHVRDALDELHDRGLPRHTVTTITGRGGQHLYYRVTTERPWSCAVLADGIELKADGGYVVVPPSVHPDSGRPYEWEWGWGP